METAIQLLHAHRAAISKVVTARSFAVHFWFAALVAAVSYFALFPSDLPESHLKTFLDTYPDNDLRYLVYFAFSASIIILLRLLYDAIKEARSEAVVYKALGAISDSGSAPKIHAYVEKIEKSRNGNIMLKTSLSASNNNDHFIPIRDIPDESFRMFRIVDEDKTTRSHRRLAVRRKNLDAITLCIVTIVDNSSGLVSSETVSAISAIERFCDAVGRLKMPTVDAAFYVINGTSVSSSNFVTFSRRKSIKLNGRTSGRDIAGVVRDRISKKPHICRDFDAHIRFICRHSEVTRHTKYMLLMLGKDRIPPISRELFVGKNINYYAPRPTNLPNNSAAEERNQRNTISSGIKIALNLGTLNDEMIDTLAPFSPFGRCVYEIEWAKEDANLNMEHLFAVLFRLTFGDRVPIEKTSYFSYLPE